MDLEDENQKLDSDPLDNLDIKNHENASEHFMECHATKDDLKSEHNSEIFESDTEVDPLLDLSLKSDPDFEIVTEVSQTKPNLVK